MSLSGLNRDHLQPFIPPVDTPKVVFSIIISVLGIAANLAAIFFILVLKEYKKSVTHWYVLQLALADTLFLLTLPFKVSEDLQQGWIYPEWMCKAKETILFFNYYASVLFLVVMSIDRYIAVCHAFSTTIQKLRTKTSATVITICVWTVALLLCIPVMLYSFKVGNAPYCQCTYEFPQPPENITEKCLKQFPFVPSKEDLSFCVEESSIPEIDNGEIHCKLFAPPKDTENSGSGSFDYADFFANGEIPNNFPFNFGSEIAGSDTNSTMNETDVDPRGLPVEIPVGVPGEIPVGMPDEISNEIPNGSPTKIPANSQSQLPNACHYDNHPLSWKIFLGFNFIVMFVVPVVVLIVCYGLIIRRFSLVTLRSASLKSTHNNKSSSVKDRKRVTILCAALVSCFILCWLPFHAIHLAKFVGINGEADFCVSILKVAGLLAYVNSALNPYLYSFLGTNLSKKWNLVKRSPGMLQLTNWRQTGRTSLARGKTSRQGTVPSRSNMATSVKKQGSTKKDKRPNHTSDSSSGQLSPSIQTRDLTEKHTQEFLDHSSPLKFSQNSFDERQSKE